MNPDTTRVLVLVGSLRVDSMNRRIAETLCAQAPAGVHVEIADGLGEIPFYNEDLDGADVPEAAAALRREVAAADRVLAVTPEYNGTMPAVLNNAIDWVSRPYPRRTAAAGRTRRPAALRASPVHGCSTRWSSRSPPSTVTSSRTRR
jgi:NAD(P)H-dependent FMN reductase